MQFQKEVNVQPPSVHDLDTIMLRHAALEAIGVLGLFAIAWGLWVRLFGLSLDVISNGALAALALVVLVISLSFILKEPAIERIAKALLAAYRARASAKAENTENVPDLKVASTNQANADYHLAVKILGAVCIAKSKEVDGEKLKGRPWTYRRCNEAGFVNKWSDWSRIMTLWERARIVDNREGKLLITSLEEGTERLRAQMVQDGYISFNGVWVKR